MKPSSPIFALELEALFAPGRRIQSVPDLVRARSLGRARAILAAAAVASPGPVVCRKGPSLVLATSLALLVGAAAASAALRGRALIDKSPAAGGVPAVAPRLPEAVAPASASPTAAPAGGGTASPRRTGRPAEPARSYAAEIALLSRADVAYAGRDFALALALVAQHERRFPDAGLAEEREALRVRLLASSGRARQARRAAASFAERFPRSVFLARLRDVAP
jgi:hypothetical protein